MEEMRDQNGTRHRENKYENVRRKSFLISPSFLTFNYIKCKWIILNANSSFQKTDIEKVKKIHYPTSSHDKNSHQNRNRRKLLQQYKGHL